MTDYLPTDDEKRAAGLAQWREDVRVMIRDQVPAMKAQLADLVEPGSGLSPAVGTALQALVAMQTTLAIQAALNHRIATIAILSQLPEEKREKASTGLADMANVVSEETQKLMDLLF